MKFTFLISVVIILISIKSPCYSYVPCSEKQKSAYDSLSLVPTVVISFDVAALAASQVLWVTSTTKSHENSKSEKKDDDMTIYWLLPSLGFELGTLMTIPRCSSLVEKDGMIFAEETESHIINNTRLAAGISIVGQFVSLTNTLDEEKRQNTRMLMGMTIINQFLFEFFWSYQEPKSLLTIQPFLKQNVLELLFVYRF